jgi:hypothetical protein
MNRQPKGVPVGGQFAEMDRCDSDVDLHCEEEAPFEQRLVFVIPTSRAAEAFARIDKANRRLERAGIDSRFEYETSETVEAAEDGRLTSVVTIAMNKMTIGQDGWNLVGVYDFTPDGDPVAAYRSDSDVVGPDSARCDQCGVARKRDRIMIARHDDGETRQVGRSCLKAFLGVSPQGLWSLEFDPTDDGETEDSDSDEPTYRGAYADQVYPVEEFLTAAVYTAAVQGGFISKARATMTDPSTVQVMLATPDLPSDHADEEQRATAAAILTWLNDVETSGDDEYIGKLRQVLVGSSGVEGRFLRRTHAAVAASAVAAYERHLQDKTRDNLAVERALQYKPGFLAAVGEKIAPVSATVERVHHGSTEIGYKRKAYWTAINMITDDGQKVAWFASGGKEIEAGQKVIVTGTVKKHGVNTPPGSGAEIDETMLTRAKLVDPETGEKLN